MRARSRPSGRHTPWIAGFLYGAGLLISGFIAAGGGHGTVLPLLLSCAPLPFVLAPGWWFLLGVLLTEVRLRAVRISFLALMAIHYVAAIYQLVTWPEDDRYRARDTLRDPLVLPFLAVPLLFYAAGQVLLWREYRRRVAARSDGRAGEDGARGRRTDTRS